MATGFRGAFVIAWAQTMLDGYPAQGQFHLSEGMTWRWHGRAMPLAGEGGALLLHDSAEHAELRARAARVVRKLMQRPAPSAAEIAADEADPIFRGAFVVTDQRKLYTIVPINLDDAAAPVLLFLGEMPPPERDLTVLHCAERTMRATPSERPSVICFTPGTRMRTEAGEIAIEDLGPGDKLLTRDSGPQEVLWSGHRRMSGARLFAMPE